VIARDPERLEVGDDGPIEPPLRVEGAAGERLDGDERERLRLRQPRSDGEPCATRRRLRSPGGMANPSTSAACTASMIPASSPGE
jgi:hypothetical protein